MSTKPASVRLEATRTVPHPLTSAKGHPGKVYRAGEVFETDAARARDLVAMAYAQEAPTKPAETPA